MTLSRKEEIFKEVTEDPLLKKVMEELDDEQRKKLEEATFAFVEHITLPMLEGFEKIMESPEAQEELRRLLRNGGKDVIKK